MAEFIYTTSTNISGPWLIDSDKLETLDKTLDEEWTRITKYQEELIKKKVDQIMEEDQYIPKEDDKRALEIESRRKEIEARVRSRSLYSDDRSITIHLKGNKKVIVKTFGEALRQQSLLEELPISFSALIQSGHIKGEFELRKNGHLDISVSPEHLPESRELFAALKRWASTVSPPKWQQFWLDFNPGQWLVWFVVLVIALSVLGNSESVAKKYYKQEAMELLKNGLSQDEQLKAIETLLALESGYIPKDQSIARPGWVTLLLFGGLMACVVLTITPKSRIGIGKGQDSINRWRLWIRVVFVLVPVFIFVNVIWPYLSKLVPNLF